MHWTSILGRQKYIYETIRSHVELSASKKKELDFTELGYFFKGNYKILSNSVHGVKKMKTASQKDTFDILLSCNCKSCIFLINTPWLTEISLGCLIFVQPLKAECLQGTVINVYQNSNAFLSC